MMNQQPTDNPPAELIRIGNITLDWHLVDHVQWLGDSNAVLYFKRGRRGGLILTERESQQLRQALNGRANGGQERGR
jgi:hypothetical protein